MQPPDLSKRNLGKTNKAIILVGATVRDAAQSAARAGFRVTGIDFFGDTDTRASCEYFVEFGESTLRQVADLHPDQATPLMVVGGTDRTRQPLVDELRRRYWVIGPTVTMERMVRQPEFLSEVARSANVQYPQWRSEPPADSDGWITKDPTSSGGISVRWAAQRSAGRFQVCFAQRWVPGRMHGATFCAHDSQAHLLGVCRGGFTRIAGRPFVYASSLGPIDLPDSTLSSISRVGQQIIRRAPLTGIFNVDVLIDRKQIVLLEINPRWTASCELIERSMHDHGALAEARSIIGLIANGVTFPRRASPIEPTRYLKRVVFSRRSGRFDRDAISQQAIPGFAFADIPANGISVKAGEPILTVIAKWPPEATTLRKPLRQIVSEIQNAICQGS